MIVCMTNDRKTKSIGVSDFGILLSYVLFGIGKRLECSPFSFASIFVCILVFLYCVEKLLSKHVVGKKKVVYGLKILVLIALLYLES